MNNKSDKISEKKTCAPLWGTLLFFILLAIDQLTKLFADAYFTATGAPSEVTLVEDWLWLRITYNRGISYGLGASASPTLKIVVIAITAVMMLGLIVWYFLLKPDHRLMRTALVFVAAGGVGNLIDRVYYRVWDPATYPLGVRDMVDLSRFGFAVCNFADFFITFGVIMLILALLFFDKDAAFPIGKYKKLAQAAEETEITEITEKEETNG